MNAYEDRVKKIYNRGDNQWLYVTQDECREINLWRANIRKHKQSRNLCSCPENKTWVCDGLCDGCVFRAYGQKGHSKKAHPQKRQAR